MDKDSKKTVPSLDDAMYAFSQAAYEKAAEMLHTILEADDKNFDALMALSMTCSRLGDQAQAIQLGHQAEQLKPGDPLVHTNLSLFYVKSGDKEKAEHHGLQAKVASWKQDMEAPGEGPQASGDKNELEIPMSSPKPATYKTPSKFPEMPWKKKES